MVLWFYDFPLFTFFFNDFFSPLASGLVPEIAPANLFRNLLAHSECPFNRPMAVDVESSPLLLRCLRARHSSGSAAPNRNLCLHSRKVLHTQACERHNLAGS
jgi:hypothetical protein